MNCGDNNDYQIVSYYPSGSIKETSEVNEHSVKEGLSIGFFENGDTARIATYKAGKLDSTEVLYYRSGGLNIRRSWRMGELFGEYREFYEDSESVYYTILDKDTVAIEGPVVSKYMFYYGEGIKYYREYDRKGRLKEEGGSGIIAFNPLEKSNEFELNDTLKIQFLLASPNYAYREFEVITYHNDSLISEENIKINNALSSAFLIKKLDRLGKYQFYVKCRIYGKMDSSVKVDTLHFGIQI